MHLLSLTTVPTMMKGAKKCFQLKKNDKNSFSSKPSETETV